MNLRRKQQAVWEKCFHPSGTFTALQPEEIEQSVCQRLEKILEQCPDRLAIKSQKCELTYRQLNEAANRVAREILAVRGQNSEPVALMFEQGAAAIIALLAG